WGMYGVGFLAFALAAAFSSLRSKFRLAIVPAVAALLLVAASITWVGKPLPTISLAGIQMEFPSSGSLPEALDKTLAKNPGAQIFVLSEYTLDGPVPESLKAWCRGPARFLVVGGKDPV